MEKNDSYISRFTDLGKKYIDSRIDEMKLRTVGGLSQAFASLLSMLVIVAVLTIVLGLLGLALLQWLNALIGAPWGTLVVSGVFLILLVILWLNRRTMFRDNFVKILISVFYDDKQV